MPPDSDLYAASGTSDADYYVVTASAVIHRQNGQGTVLWRTDTMPCLRSVLFVQGDVIAAGGCDRSGSLLVQHGGGPWTYQQVPNIDLSGSFAFDKSDVFIASPTIGVLRVRDGDLHIEQTVPEAQLGSGPVALWGTGADLYAVGNGQILHRLGDDRWEVLRDRPGEEELGIWGSAADDIYVVGAARGEGTIWHRSGADPLFQPEPIDQVAGQVKPARIVAIWGSGKDDVYAAGDGGLVLRRQDGHWVVDRPGAPDQPIVRALWGSKAQAPLGVGPAGIVQRTPDGKWQQQVGMALTGATLHGTSLAGNSALVVGEAGVILRRQGGAWMREGAGLTSVALYGTVALADGTAYAVGQAGTVLRRQPDGTWVVEALPAGDGGDGGMPVPMDGSADGGADGGMAAPDLLAVAALPGGTAYAVGVQGQLLSRQGGLWQVLPPALDGLGNPVLVTLRAVAALHDGTVIAAGDHDTVLLRSPGATAFSVARSDPGTSLSWTGLVTVPGAAGPEVWGSADGAATLLRYQAGGLTQVEGPLVHASAIWGAAADDLYLADRNGAVQYFDGYRWRAEDVPQGEALLSLSGTGGGDLATVLAVGEQGFVIGRP